MIKKLLLFLVLLPSLILASQHTSKHEEMVLVAGGCFKMGDTFGGGDDDEKPVHTVCVDDFYIGKYLVTQKQWIEVMNNNPSEFKNCDYCPVERVNWDDVQEFINKLNERGGKRYRLPTEAEWEYAARSGGKKEKWAGTSNEWELGNYVWYNVNSGGMTHSVGQKKPNGLGLYDMSGNVWEWVQDKYVEDFYRNSRKNNPVSPSFSSSKDRVLRGGSWANVPGFARTSMRYGYFPGSRLSFVGVRLVHEAP